MTNNCVISLCLGGELIFDPDAAFLELNAEYIVVVGGGKVQIGTEESPHQGQAAITLHGNVRATELPVYGAKVCLLAGTRSGNAMLLYVCTYAPPQTTW